MEAFHAVLLYLLVLQRMSRKTFYMLTCLFIADRALIILETAFLCYKEGKENINNYTFMLRY